MKFLTKLLCIFCKSAVKERNEYVGVGELLRQKILNVYFYGMQVYNA